MCCKKNSLGFTLIIAAAIIVLAGVYCLALKTFWFPENGRVAVQPNTMVGNDRDAHGCIGSAGYSWCEVKNKCLRIWEEKCENAASAVDTTGWKIYQSAKYGLEIKYPATCEQGTADGSLANFACDGQDQSAKDNINIKFIKGSSAGQSEEKSFEDIIIANTIFDGSGLNPKSIDEFTKVKIGDNLFYKIKTGRFEGILSYVYYLPRGHDALSFSFISRGVDWTNPNLDEEADATHVILKQMLATLKFTK